MFRIANNDLKNASDIVIQFSDGKCYVIDLNIQPKCMTHGVPKNETCEFIGYELTENLFEEGRLADCNDDKKYTYENGKLVKISRA